MYTKENYKREITKILHEKGYDPTLIANLTYDICMNNLRDIDNNLYENLLNIANTEMGPEFEMTGKEFKKFLEDM